MDGGFSHSLLYTFSDSEHEPALTRLEDGFCIALGKTMIDLSPTGAANVMHFVWGGAFTLATKNTLSKLFQNVV